MQYSPFRNFHILEILFGLEKSFLPLDLFLGNYLRANKAIGSQDRTLVVDTVYGIIRHLRLLDHLSQAPYSWEQRLEVYKSPKFQAAQNDTSIPPAVRASFPDFLKDLIFEQYGEEKGFFLMKSLNERAPLTVRANTSKTTREALINKLKVNYPVFAGLYSPTSIHFSQRVNFSALPEFKEGLFEVQDEGSQVVSDNVHIHPKDILLDYCSGSGGKTLAIAPRLEGRGRIYLHDIRENALFEAKKRLKRAGVQNSEIVSSKSFRLPELKGRMDCVVVDAPCSGLGTLRRNPDMKWKITPEKLEGIRQDQRAIVEEAISFLRPKGRLSYITCSLLQVENEDQVKFFTENFPLKEMAPSINTLPKDGEKMEMDGFFLSQLILN